MSAQTVLDLLVKQATERLENPAYTFLSGGQESSRLSFSELYERARAIGARLQSRRAEGERALLLYPPGLEYIGAFYGCLSAGVIAVPAYPPRVNRNLQRIESILEDC